MIDLYSVPTTNGQRVHIMLEEAGLSYTPHIVDLPGGKHLDPEFLAKNPFGRVPAIIDRDGPNGAEVTLFEGHAILYYLAEKSGRFYPDDLAVRAEIHTWMSAVSANIGPAFSALFWFRNLAPEKSQMTLDRYVAEAHRGLRALDTHLEGRDYVAGDAYSIADIHAYPVAATSINSLDGGIDDYPALKRWRDSIAERDAVKLGMALFVD